MQKSTKTLKNAAEMIDIYFTHTGRVRLTWPNGQVRSAPDTGFFARELKKLGAIQSYPCDARGIPSPEIDWLSNTNGWLLDTEATPFVLQLIDYVEKM